VRRLLGSAAGDRPPGSGGAGQGFRTRGRQPAGGPWTPGARWAAPASSSAAPSPSGKSSGPSNPQEPSAAALLDRLDADLREFRLQFGRFFAGERPVPPDDLRADLQSRLRQARGASGGLAPRSVADLFRLSQLEAQFNSYSELYNRRLRQAEEGPRRAPVAPPRLQPDGPSPDVIAGLYRTLYPSGPIGDAPDLERFGAFIASQAETLRRRTGCRDVAFRIAVDQGKPRLMARPIGGPGRD
jgi:hypothetical protein